MTPSNTAGSYVQITRAISQYSLLKPAGQANCRCYHRLARPLSSETTFLGYGYHRRDRRFKPSSFPPGVGPAALIYVPLFVLGPGYSHSSLLLPGRKGCWIRSRSTGWIRAAFLLELSAFHHPPPIVPAAVTPGRFYKYVIKKFIVNFCSRPVYGPDKLRAQRRVTSFPDRSPMIGGRNNQ